MKLKRTGSKNSQKKKEKSEAFISRQAPGMCFDFHHKVSWHCYVHCRGMQQCRTRSTGADSGRCRYFWLIQETTHKCFFVS